MTWAALLSAQMSVPVHARGHIIKEARRGNIAGHRKTVTQLCCRGLILTGAFTLLPGRVMHNVVFEGLAQ